MTAGNGRAVNRSVPVTRSMGGIWLLLLAGTPLLPGCSSIRYDNLSSEQPGVELIPSEHGRFWGVIADSTDSRLEVSGEIIRQHSYSFLRRGVVRIELLDSTGATITEMDITPQPSAAARPRGRHYRFFAVLDVRPPEGSRLRITHIAHPRATPKDGTSICSGVSTRCARPYGSVDDLILRAATA